MHGNAKIKPKIFLFILLKNGIFGIILRQKLY